MKLNLILILYNLDLLKIFQTSYDIPEQEVCESLSEEEDISENIEITNNENSNPNDSQNDKTEGW